MNYQSIYSELKEAGFSWRMAAEAIGCSAGNLTNVAARKATSRRTALGLCLILGRSPKEVFPDVPSYHEDHKAIRKERVAAAKAKIESAGLRVCG